MKKLIVLIFILLMAGALYFVLRGEDVWLCSNGEWIKHGNPSSQKPGEPCGVASITPFPSTISFKVYFGNKNSKVESEECKAASPVTREIPYTVTAAKDSIDELLKGPTNEEISKGYYTNIGKGVTLQKISIKDGVAKVDFDENLEKAVGGSCRVSFIRSQIVSTLEQFPSIKEVIISINGRTEDILQP